MNSSIGARPQPIVSVVMAVYNGSDKLATTIESLLAQSFEAFELILVDDGSTDPSAQVLWRYANQDSRVRVLQQSNEGLTRALIAGCAQARGTFIARQDVGDRAWPRRLERQVDYLKRHDRVVAVGAGFHRVGPEGEFLGESLREGSPESVTEALLRQGICIPHPLAMFRRQAYQQVGGYRAEFRFAQDADLWYRLSRIGMLGEVPEPLLDMRIDVDGISPTNRDRQFRLAQLAKDCYLASERSGSDASVLKQAGQVSWGDVPDAPGITPRMARANAEFFIGSQLYALGDQRCREYLRRAIGHRPLWLRPWAKYCLSFLKPRPKDNGSLAPAGLSPR
ncbi:glycosyltransferase family 2 protein [Roseiconus nitratireducens]|uniref:Glycosyltransferase family 2 protein n=1 Tax=Roseiconus nitratireducens TaxID=2605748 RepID=A0A5M6DBX3_9BACT|nr:glycosyltransferase family 2 protein [Roseiconus nitratireducens]KAA5543822.1 glycosyltransferase family 2 protein [Roseiconus nitratireducens]